jgi:hypothetical protein
VDSTVPSVSIFFLPLVHYRRGKPPAPEARLTTC